MITVKGFLLYEVRNRGTAERILIEHQYAVMPDGTVKHCSFNGTTNSFGKTSQGIKATWDVVPELPDNAEFIGNYPMDM